MFPSYVSKLIIRNQIISQAGIHGPKILGYVHRIARVWFDGHSIRDSLQLPMVTLLLFLNWIHNSLKKYSQVSFFDLLSQKTMFHSYPTKETNNDLDVLTQLQMYNLYSITSIESTIFTFNKDHISLEQKWQVSHSNLLLVFMQ